MDLQFAAADFHPNDQPHLVEGEKDRAMRPRPRFVIAVGMVMAMVFSAFVVVVRANGAPVDVFLNHIPGVSNWGPPSASGRAVVAVGEGEVRLETKGLPRLKDERYQVWLERADTGELISVGLFNSDSEGKGELHVLLDDLPYTEYRAMWITVEPSPDPDAAPSAKRSLVGRFPNMQLAKEALLQPATDGVSAGTSARGGTGGDGPRPEFLPVTGGTPEARDGASLLPLSLLVVGVVAVVAWYARRRGIR